MFSIFILPVFYLWKNSCKKILGSATCSKLKTALAPQNNMKREAARAMNLGSATVAGAEPHVLRILGPLEHGIRKPVGIVET
jgi:hypothetical protein